MNAEVNFASSSSLSFLLLRIFLCIFCAGWALYGYIDKQNQLTEIQRTIPLLKKEVATITRENSRLQYEIDRFENPLHLMELARKPEFGHLKYPYVRDVIVIPNEDLP